MAGAWGNPQKNTLGRVGETKALRFSEDRLLLGPLVSVGNTKGVSTINIVQIIEELESVAETGTRVPGLRKRIMVDIDRLTAVVQELRTSVPADIQEASEILKQKDSIVNQAQLEGRRIKDAASQAAEEAIEAARHEQEARVSETEIVKGAEARAEEVGDKASQEAEEALQEAQRRAYQILAEAEAQAASRRDGADQYARETLFAIEERLAGQLGQVRRGIDALGTDRDAMIPVPAVNGAD